MTVQLLMRRGRLVALLTAALLTGCGQRDEPAAITPPPMEPPAAERALPHYAEEDVEKPAREAAEAGRATTITVTDADDGRTLGLQKGQAVVVRLPADRGAGMTWIPAGNALPVVSTDGIPGYEPANATGAAGPGIEIWRFVALQPGQAELVFEYRSLQGGDRSMQTLVFRFEVE